ncbi:MAG: SHOCT domain-containing protein [Solirubrobacterales bacterium]
MITDGVDGDAEVLEKELTRLGAHQTDKLNRPWKLRLSVDTAGEKPYEVEHVCTIPWDKLPRTGQTVPVTISKSHPERLRIEWDRIPSLTEAAKQAEELVKAGDLDGAAAAMGLRRSGGEGSRRFAPAEPQETAERIALVAKLQRLREDGALSDQEFEAEKRRLLSE